MSKIPICEEDISAKWLTDRLTSLGYCRIDKLQLEVLTGHNPHLSQLFRVQIEYSARTSNHPNVVVLKIPPADHVIRLREAALGPYESEAGCYQLLEKFQGFSLPLMYSLTQNSDEATACFVFEDIGPLPKGRKYAQLGLQERRQYQQ